jgi:hypothetical protein
VSPLSSSRRAFLAALAAGWAGEALASHAARFRGGIVGASHAAGHLLRGPHARGPVRARTRADVVIVGGGVAGLSAAWRLAGAGLDIRVLELEPFAGGTSASGEAGGTSYPWGAHYVPVPNPETRAALRLLSEIGALTGWDAAGRPRFDPRVLCHAPQERLFYRGAWIEGLTPPDLDARERADLERFDAIESELGEHVGADGRPAFQLPLALSSRDPELLALDRLSFAAWLDREGLRSPFVRWYTRYACLDDFGGLPEHVSAWAGLHYFASRRARGPDLEGSRFLVWPEGNGRLVRALQDGGRPRVETGAIVLSVTALAKGGVEATYLDVATRELRVVEARAAVLAAPAFVVMRILQGASGRLPKRVSSPWIVANLHVRRPFEPDLAWDSVLYDADGLGYVDARHQLTELRDSTVLTYYRAFGAHDVAATRASLLAATWGDLASAVLQDLWPAHPDLSRQLERVDVMIWGHGMPRPEPGFLGERPFEVPCELGHNIAWAHVDQSGVALFEEAQARGVQAAEALAPAIGVELGETWL